jgi:hypothetical protein
MFLLFQKNPLQKIFSIGRFIDAYLMLVARNENLSAKSFQSLAKAMPKDAQYCDKNVYRAIDIYIMFEWIAAIDILMIFSNMVFIVFFPLSTK